MYVYDLSGNLGGFLMRGIKVKILCWCSGWFFIVFLISFLLMFILNYGESYWVMRNWEK